MILIEHNGERSLVSSLEGYDGATVLCEDVCEQPNEFCSLIDGEWVEDTPRKDESDRRAAILNQDPVGRFDELQARIAELEAQLMIMTPLVEELTQVDLSK